MVAIVPARNEAATIGKAVRSLLAQNYSGEFSVIVVDDHSEDGTGAVAESVAREHGGSSRLQVVPSPPLAAEWTGKVLALNAGANAAAASEAVYYWLTDADVVHAEGTLEKLVSRAERDHLDLASLMVLLRTGTLAERAFIPAFLFFFLKLYPPAWIANVRSRTAGAAGGCLLLRREALERIGGFTAIRGEVIDDCALARAVKRGGGQIWMGLTRASLSLRSYGSAGEIRDMIARTAFTQLRYSALFLCGAVAGLLFTYFAPLALLFSGNAVARTLGFGAWLLMSISFLPTIRFYRLSPLWAPSLPVSAAFYTYATLLSAVRFWLGRGAQWKGRTQAPHMARDA